MHYIELHIAVRDTAEAEITLARLSDWPFESFSEEEGGLSAYIPEAAFAGCRADIKEALRAAGLAWKERRIEDQNWNALWESNFEPIAIDERCTIRAPFHPAPEQGLDIVIMPKMSFGTGHHATTRLMVEELLEMELAGLNGLDIGCGTGVLAIVAAARGAARVDAIDIDEWAYTNCTENIATNGFADRIDPQQGDAGLLAGRRYDFVLANINRNILLADIPYYTGTLGTGRRLVMSGILEADIPAIVSQAEAFGMRCDGQRLREGWAAVRFTKN